MESLLRGFFAHAEHPYAYDTPRREFFFNYLNWISTPMDHFLMDVFSIGQRVSISTTTNFFSVVVVIFDFVCSFFLRKFFFFVSICKVKIKISSYQIFTTQKKQKMVFVRIFQGFLCKASNEKKIERYIFLKSINERLFPRNWSSSWIFTPTFTLYSRSFVCLKEK